MSKNKYTVGVISDSHGLLRPEVVGILKDVDHILHAGDIDLPQLRDTLNHIAPVTAVRGNMDRGTWAHRLPKWEIIHLGDTCLYIIHDISEMDVVPEAAGIDIVISGHTHRQSLTKKNGIIYLNPGSIGPRRYKDVPISLALLYIDDGKIDVQMRELKHID